MKSTQVNFYAVQALRCGNSVVSVEVALSVQRLVKKYGSELDIVAWDAVLDIAEALQEQVEVRRGMLPPIKTDIQTLLW